MPITPNTVAAQKAGYLILTSATLHCCNHEVSNILMRLRSQIAREMTPSDLFESLALLDALIYPRFS